MREQTVTFYFCGVCGERYDSAENALACEKLEIRKSHGLKAGDRVRIEQHPISREIGKEAAVTAIEIIRHPHGKLFHEEMVTIELSNPPGQMTVSPEWLVKL